MKSEEITHMDCLSTANIKTSKKATHFLDKETKNIEDQNINVISIFSINATSIAKETERDTEYSKLKRSLLYEEM